ncbi:oligosaccharide biosynthesis protein Alg14 [uncultured Dysgonomonas sp.]|uniref:Oligosaccharide biosynthesis protein Alg14 like protein n=1 Tax=uncultured Dysgonomonas sp. TaxID=206096 RepID=A0A212J8I9_9BACT|nr:oligosaccharide biosynthesis protein Alg14 [uncultured Dysgonomonas sp.]SBV95740.1 Oligosaccharide biosynthesis protein Alg14 like protein [uncultured Dysgonomonas sp.]
MKTPIKKILAIASIGGHWKQLLCIVPQTFNDIEIVYVSTHPKCAIMVEGNRFYSIDDFSRWNAYKVVPVFFQAIKILRKEKPCAVITTGAAPGLITLFAAKLFGIKTFWVDSVANIQGLSLSGRIASKFVTQAYTQWQELASDKVLYKGNVFD